MLSNQAVVIICLTCHTARVKLKILNLCTFNTLSKSMCKIKYSYLFQSCDMIAFKMCNFPDTSSLLTILCRLI